MKKSGFLMQLSVNDLFNLYVEVEDFQGDLGDPEIENKAKRIFVEVLHELIFREE